MAGGVEDSPFFRERVAKGSLVVHGKLQGHRKLACANDNQILPSLVLSPTLTSILVRHVSHSSLENLADGSVGRTRLDRLAVIGSTSTYLSIDALSRAVIEAKQLGDVDAYLNVAEALKTLNLPETVIAKLPKDVQTAPDMAWAERRTKEAKHETDRLEAELRTYKNNLIKESIRMANEELGKHYYNIGDYTNAYKAYGRMRDYCTTQKHIADMTLHLIFVAIAQKQWGTVSSYCAKLHTVTLKPEERERIQPIDQACNALQYLQTNRYDQAANEFLRIDPAYVAAEAQANIVFQKEVMTGNDIAVYGGLCALASMDRETLQRRVLDNTGFRQFLELEPHIRRAISAFTQSKYTTCLQILDSYRTDYLLDLHLQKHFEELYQKIRSKAIVQYFIPFSRVTLAEMEKAFPPRSGKTVESELVVMIQRGLLDARIDLVDKVYPHSAHMCRALIHY